jgi:two-component system LytT family response regulator
MIRTIIIDDEPRNIKLVEGIIRDHCPNIEVVGTTDDLLEVQPLVEDLRPSLLLLDIEFPSGNIFTVLEKLSFRSFHVIFITAHNTYAAEAFRQNAVDYILKPITRESLINAIRRAEEKIHANAVTDISKLVKEFKSGLRHAKKIPLPSSEGILFVDETEIVRCEASGRYTILHLQPKKSLTVTKTLKEIETLLDTVQFFRVHNSHIINLDMIKKYHRGHGGSVELTDGSLVEVSTRRKDSLLKILLRKTED